MLTGGRRLRLYTPLLTRTRRKSVDNGVVAQLQYARVLSRCTP